jgi:hypothetical protein
VNRKLRRNQEVEVSDNEWLMRVENGLSAHFKEEDGTSRPGVDWAIGIKRGEETFTVRVKALLTDDATKATRRDQQYQAQTAMQYLNDELRSGWDPAQEREHTIYIGNPHPSVTGEAPTPPGKPWWKIW